LTPSEITPVFFNVENGSFDQTVLETLPLMGRMPMQNATVAPARPEMSALAE
jgi:hypothetical protein